MGQPIKHQGKTTNKLIVTWKDYSEKDYGTERESFKCNSLDKATDILSRKDKRRVFFARYFDNTGQVHTISLNTKDTILSI